MQSIYLDQIRSFEGYTPKAEWDYAQFTNGYGTKARYAGEVISKAEAERRFKTEIAEARSIVEKVAPGVDEGTKAALTSLTFNAGPGWAKSGLGEAVRAGDIDRAREIFVQYNKAGGDVVDGLVKRRLQEVTWMGNPDAAVGAMASISSFGTVDLPGIPSAARADLARFVPAQGDPLGELLASVSRPVEPLPKSEGPVTGAEALVVAQASDAIESVMASDLALMAQTGAGAGGVLQSYQGDVARADDSERRQRGGSAVSA